MSRQNKLSQLEARPQHEKPPPDLAGALESDLAWGSESGWDWGLGLGSDSDSV